MVINDIMFKTHLNYQIQANAIESEDTSLDLKDVQHIDLHRCYFSEFKKAMEYIREHNSDYNFSDFTINAVKPAPADFSENKKYDFVELTDYAKHTAITIGNMSLFSELQKIASAAETFNYQVYKASATPEKKIVACYEVTEWKKVTDENGKPRFGFDGTPIKDDPMIGQPVEQIAHARGGVVFYTDNWEKE